MNSGITDLTQLANLALTDLGTLNKDLLLNWETDDTELGKKVRTIMPFSIRAVQSQFRWRTLAGMQVMKPRSYLDYVDVQYNGEDYRMYWNASSTRYEDENNTSNYIVSSEDGYTVRIEGWETSTPADEAGYPQNGLCLDDQTIITQEKVYEVNTQGFRYRCELPSDFLEPYVDNEVPCVLEGGYLFSDSLSFPYRYIRYIDDPTKWDSQMANVIRAKLTLDLYVPADNDEASHSKYLQIYNGLIKPLAERMESYNTNIPSKSYRKSGIYSTTRSGGIAWRR